MVASTLARAWREPAVHVDRIQPDGSRLGVGRGPRGGHPSLLDSRPNSRPGKTAGWGSHHRFSGQLRGANQPAWRLYEAMDAESATRWARAAICGRRSAGCRCAAELARALPGAIQTGLRSGRLHRVHREVYVLGHRPATREVKWQAWPCLRAVRRRYSAIAPPRLRGPIREGESWNVTSVTSPAGCGRGRHGIQVKPRSTRG